MTVAKSAVSQYTREQFDSLLALSDDEVVTHSYVRDVALPSGGNLALVTLDNGRDHTRPSTLGPQGLLELAAVLDELSQRASAGEIQAVAVTGKPFILAAGADQLVTEEVMKALALMLAVIMLAATGWYYHDNRVKPDTLVTDDAAIDFDDPDTLDPQQLEAEQRAAADAALTLAGEPPLAGKLTERPEFVSRIEWQILKAVAATQQNSEQELLRLVNYLRFSKQLEWWQSQQPDQQCIRQKWRYRGNSQGGRCHP